MPGCGVVGVLAHIAADGPRGRLDNHRAIDDSGGGKPARRDMRMVQAHPGTAVHTDPGRVRGVTEPGAVETVHRPGTSPGQARLVVFMCRASGSGRRRGPGRRDRRSARLARPAPPDAAGRTCTGLPAEAPPAPPRATHQSRLRSAQADSIVRPGAGQLDQVAGAQLLACEQLNNPRPKRVGQRPRATHQSPLRSAQADSIVRPGAGSSR